MPHSCRICGKQKANESFSGRGHKTHICKSCQARPKEERDAILHEDEIFGFLNQSNISAKNISCLRELATSENAKTSMLARIVLDVSLVKPHKRKRLVFLAQTDSSLLRNLEETGLIHAHHWQ